MKHLCIERKTKQALLSLNSETFYSTQQKKTIVKHKKHQIHLYQQQTDKQKKSQNNQNHKITLKHQI